MTLFLPHLLSPLSSNMRAFIHKHDVCLCISQNSLDKSVLFGAGLFLFTSMASGCSNTCKNGIVEEGETCADIVIHYASDGEIQVPIGADVVNPIAMADLTGDGSDDVFLRINLTNQLGIWLSDDLVEASQTDAINAGTTLGDGNIVEIPADVLAISDVTAVSCQFDADAAREMLIFAEEFAGDGSITKTFLVDQRAGLDGGQAVTVTFLEEEANPFTLFFSFQPICFDTNNDGIDEIWYNTDSRIFQSSVDVSILDQEDGDEQDVIHDDQLVLDITEINGNNGNNGGNGDIFSFLSNILHDADGDGDMDLLAYDASGTLVFLRNDGEAGAIDGAYTAFFQNLNGTDFNFGVTLANFGNDDTVELFQVSSDLTFVSLSRVDVGHIAIENADASNPTIRVVTNQKLSVSEGVRASFYQYTNGVHAGDTALFVVGNTYAQQMYPEIDSTQKTTLRLGNYFNLPTTDDGGLVFVSKIADVNADGSADILSDSQVYLSTP